MSTSIVSKRLISHAEYHQMGEIGLLKPDEKVELINGEIYTMSPIGSRHAAVLANLARLCHTLIDEVIVWPQNPLYIDQWNEPEPDLAILRAKKGRYASALPEPTDVEAVIEISDTSYYFDRSVKLSIYASAGISLYWIINLKENRIEVYSHPRSDQYANKSFFYPGESISLMSGVFEVTDLLILS